MWIIVVIVVIVVVFMLLIFAPPFDLHIQPFQPLPHIRFHTVRVAERSEYTPTKGRDARKREVSEREVREAGEVCGLEREAEREEGLERSAIWGGEGEVLDVWERR